MKSKILSYRILKFNRLDINVKFQKPELNFELYHLSKHLNNYDRPSWNAALNKIKRLVIDDVPLSYLMKAHPFLNINLSVFPKVLVPRNETEEYTAALISRIKTTRSTETEPLRILDIGSGSGCIALALACNLERTEVTAVDKSRRCCINAMLNVTTNLSLLKTFKSSVNIKRADFLSTDLILDRRYDLIVSNPPYIPTNKKKKVDFNVLKYESHNALFPKTCIRNGTYFHLKILTKAHKLLRRSSDFSAKNLPRIVLEIDGKEQIAPLKKALKALNFQKYYFRKDVRKVPRSVWIY